MRGNERVVVQHAIRTALLAERLDDRYAASAELHARVDLLEQWLAMAVPALPVAMAQIDLFLWVRNMVAVLADEARDAEMLKQEMNRNIRLDGPSLRLILCDECTEEQR